MEIPHAKRNSSFTFRLATKLQISLTICSRMILEPDTPPKNVWIIHISRNTKKLPESSANKCLTSLLTRFSSNNQLWDKRFTTRFNNLMPKRLKKIRKNYPLSHKKAMGLWKRSKPNDDILYVTNILIIHWRLMILIADKYAWQKSWIHQGVVDFRSYKNSAKNVCQRSVSDSPEAFIQDIRSCETSHGD